MKYYLHGHEILQRLGSSKILLFGAGEDGKRFIELYKKELAIIGILDNSNKTRDIDGIPVYDGSKIPESSVEEKIIITSSRYSHEIATQLSIAGFKMGHDFFVWLDDKRELSNNESKIINEYIHHNYKIFTPFHIKENSKSKILIKFFEFHGTFFVFYSYIVNILAERYNAKIISFKETSSEDEGLSEQLYKSFNTVGSIKKTLTAEQEMYAYKKTCEYFSNLHTKEDWLNISIDGENFGLDIVSHYIRFVDPLFDLSNKEILRDHLYSFICDIIFWKDYFRKNSSVKAVVIGDAVYRDGILARIAMKHKINVYSLNSLIAWKYSEELMRCFDGLEYPYYKKYFDELSDTEKNYGISWAESRLKARFSGDVKDIPYMMNKSVYSLPKTSDSILRKNNKVKVMICVHSFTDYPYPMGRYIFSDLYEWLCFLGEISEKTDYDWYIKPHPDAPTSDKFIISKLVSKYSKIQVLPAYVSPYQLKKEGMRFALTLWGTIGHEYPALGIHVINGSAINPHCAFDFNWHAKTLKEYTKMLMNLNTIEKTVDINEMYKFYCVHFLYNKKRKMRWDMFFKNPRLHCYEASEGNVDSYRLFLDEWSEERGVEILKNAREYLAEIDGYKIGMFAKEDIFNIKN